MELNKNIFYSWKKTSSYHLCQAHFLHHYNKASDDREQKKGDVNKNQKSLGNVVEKRKKLRKKNITVGIKRNCSKETTLIGGGWRDFSLPPQSPKIWGFRKEKRIKNIKAIIMHCNAGPHPPKGKLNSEWIYEVIVTPKMQTKNYKDFYPHHTTQCPRTDLGKRFLPKPMTTTGWKVTP